MLTSGKRKVPLGRMKRTGVSSDFGSSEPSVSWDSDSDSDADSGCIDEDEDGFGERCEFGDDCDDADAGDHPSPGVVQHILGKTDDLLNDFLLGGKFVKQLLLEAPFESESLGDAECHGGHRYQ